MPPAVFEALTAQIKKQEEVNRKAFAERFGGLNVSRGGDEGEDGVEDPKELSRSEREDRGRRRRRPVRG